MKNTNKNNSPKNIVVSLTRAVNGQYKVTEAFGGQSTSDNFRRVSARNTARLLNRNGLVIK